MKPHSYFLLINYISSTVFSLLLEAFAYQAILHSPTVGLKVLIWVLIVLTLTFLIINVTAFLHYIFNDDIRSSFHHFYVYYQICYTVVALAFATGFLIFNIATVKHFDIAFTVVTYLSTAIVFLSLLLMWSFRLKAVINGHEEPVTVGGANDARKEFIGEGVRVEAGEHGV